MASGKPHSVKQEAIIELARVLYWTRNGVEAPTDERALEQHGKTATIAIETMQRLGWHRG